MPADGLGGERSSVVPRSTQPCLAAPGWGSSPGDGAQSCSPSAAPCPHIPHTQHRQSSGNSGEDNRGQGGRKKIPSTIFCRFLFNLKTKSGFVREGDGGCSWKFLGFSP